QGTFALLAKAKSVTHVSGMNCHPSLGKDTAYNKRGMKSSANLNWTAALTCRIPSLTCGTRYGFCGMAGRSKGWR
ncbi:hypothetical protein GFL89_17730, partial [Rhizobium leguminosarum bv. viciae]|nr:hypothetical protein [Rhizobium leguminosarum bv. viciae]